MTDKIKAFFYEYKEYILYIFFGGLTTLSNIISYALLRHLFSIDELTATVIAFIISVIFAFFTNRKWVFESKASGFKAILSEGIKFFGSRLFSGGTDLLIMFIFVTQAGFNDMLIKILSNILVIILNYLLSKVFVFKKKKP